VRNTIVVLDTGRLLSLSLLLQKHKNIFTDSLHEQALARP